MPSFFSINLILSDQENRTSRVKELIFRPRKLIIILLYVMMVIVITKKLFPRQTTKTRI
jgi:hypothetical protein